MTFQSYESFLKQQYVRKSVNAQHVLACASHVTWAPMLLYCRRVQIGWVMGLAGVNATRLARLAPFRPPPINTFFFYSSTSFFPFHHAVSFLLSSFRQVSESTVHFSHMLSRAVSHLSQNVLTPLAHPSTCTNPLKHTHTLWSNKHFHCLHL